MAFVRNLPQALRSFQFASVSVFSKTLPSSWNGPRKTSDQKYSTDSANLNLIPDNATGITILEMKRKPVNSLNLDFLAELTATLDKLEKDSNTKGVIITSAQPKIFSAGLDLLEMYNPKPDRLREFWRALQNFWMRLYLSPLATAAAINGHSPAGGCLIATACDHRVMASGSYTIGLNETKLGIVAPFWFIDTLVNVIGQRQSERAVQLGRLYGADEALKIGLVDEVAPESEIVKLAKEELEDWVQVPEYARYLSKVSLRKETVDRLVAKQDQDIETFVNLITKDSIQKALKIYLEALKRKN